jgi:hypothetical protein
MGKKKNRRQQFPPVSAVALAQEPAPTSHLVQTLATEAVPLRAEDAAWFWFTEDEYRRGSHRGKTRKQIGRSLRRNSFLAGYRAGYRNALADVAKG